MDTPRECYHSTSLSIQTHLRPWLERCSDRQRQISEEGWTHVDPGEGSIQPTAEAVPSLGYECALVITRPPETYCLIRAHTGQIMFRDSHRRKQTDFADKRAFAAWLEKDQTFTAPMDGCPLVMNQLAITSIRPTEDGALTQRIADAMVDHA
eukprot:TRINITY_DN9602_c0_g1_i3.p2 TRINITY_DN9602_c0_g1~~TRINITY_DN9602_c0_g1_i3.p2  ORF type:complete len:152 (+),score=21.64 TRINITY_DN9602_c0_g1_i3:995-1450(+)